MDLKVYGDTSISDGFVFMYIVCIVQKYFPLNFLFGSPIQDPCMYLELNFPAVSLWEKEKGKSFHVKSI